MFSGIVTAQNPLPENYSFLHPEINYLQFYQRQDIEPVLAKFTQTDNARLCILHIGDSHIQADKFSGETRKELQKKYGNAGRGLVFPYSTAHTHAAADYSTGHKGRWLYAKNVEPQPEVTMGIAGAGSRTKDTNAQFSFYFKQSISQNDKKIILFCNTQRESFDLLLHTEFESIPIKVYNDKNSGTVEINLNRGSNQLTFEIIKNDSLQNFFEVYGLSIENPENKGVLYHSTGINGASTFGILRQHLFNEHLSILNPDIVIIDIGVNDYYRFGLNKSEFYYNYSKIIANIRKNNAAIKIILNSVQDAGRGGYSHPDGPLMSEIVKDMANTFHCAFYDWFYISGGKKSIFKWNANNMANWDMIHLTDYGYRYKGSMFYNAFENTKNYLKNNPDSLRLIFNIDTIINPPVDTAALRKAEEERQRRIAEQKNYVYQWIYHRVVYGQNIWTIANYYGVTAYQIKVWNKMRTYNVYRGQVLKIYTRVKVTPAPLKPPVNSGQGGNVKPPVTSPSTGIKTPPKTLPVKTPVKSKVVYHKVRAGESLYGIATKYKTTVSAIQKLNGLRNYNIKPGQTLRVK